MESIIVKGGNALNGEIITSGSKNASLPIIAASLLTEDTVKVTNIPKLVDITTMRQLLEQHGASVSIDDHPHSLTYSITTKNITNFTAPYDIVCKMRASIWVLAPLLARFNRAQVSLPGGCAIGSRQVDLHIEVLKAMGAKIEIENGYINAIASNGLFGTHFAFSKKSVGATITAIMAATLARGETVLLNCAREPEIIDLCHCLNNMGAEILGIGTDEIRIIGKNYLHGTTHQVMSDRIEAGTYMIASAITEGDIRVKNIALPLIENLAIKLESAGLEVTNETHNDIRVRYIGHLKPVNIETEPYPGFATDLQAQFMSLMSISTGTAIIKENIFENRFMHVHELCRMGANINVKNNSAIVQGVKQLKGAEVMASDLRASVSLVLAGLAAKGVTKIQRIYHLDRGYQLLEQKLLACGANIQRVRN